MGAGAYYWETGGACLVCLLPDRVDVYLSPPPPPVPLVGSILQVFRGQRRMSARSGDEKIATLRKGNMVKRVKLKGRPVWIRLPLLLTFAGGP